VTPAAPGEVGSTRTAPGLRALKHVHDQARAADPVTAARLAAVLPGRAPLDARATTAWLRSTRVAVHFHPDRVAVDGRLVVRALLDDGIYRSQFETGISNGGLTAVPGGDRDRWEDDLFGGAYHHPPAAPGERPRYGALDLFGHPDGPAPRFGSCYLRLRPHVLADSTFTCGDTNLSPPDRGTADAFGPVLAGLLEAVAHGWTLGVPDLDPAGLLALPTAGPAAPAGRSLDEYVEVQVHRPIHLGPDVEGLVADPAFAAGPVGALLHRVARRYGVPLTWHHGFELAPADVPADFRGPAMPPLAREVLRDFGGPGPRLDVAAVGRAAVAARDDPARLQLLKQLWHTLVRFGRPRGGG
jgi:Protein of unknown function (DUF3626)